MPNCLLVGVRRLAGLGILIAIALVPSMTLANDGPSLDNNYGDPDDDQNPDQAEAQIKECVCTLIDTPLCMAYPWRKALGKHKRLHDIRLVPGWCAGGNPAVVVRRTGVLLINIDETAWTDPAMHRWKKGALTEEARHIQQAGVFRCRFHPPEDAADWLHDAAAAYRELDASMVVLRWLWSLYVYQSTWGATTADRPDILRLYRHWLGHLRTQVERICGHLSDVEALDAADPWRQRLLDCKSKGRRMFDRKNEWIGKKGETTLPPITP